jgi:hypothetical protein
MQKKWWIWVAILGIVGSKITAKPLQIINVKIDNSAQLIQAMEEKPLVLIHFLDFADGQSKGYAQTFEAVLGLLGDAYAPLSVATIGSLVKEVTKEYRVSRFPAIKMAVNGHIVDFHGVPDVDGVLKWLKTILTSSNINYIDSEDQLEELGYLDVAAMMVSPETDKEQAKEIQAAAAAFPDIQFFITSLDKPTSHLDLKFKHTLLLYRSFEDEPRVIGHDLPIPFARLKDFIQLFRYPLVRRLTPQVLKDVFRDKEDGLFYFYDSRRAEDDRVLLSLAPQLGLQIRVYSCDFANPSANDMLQVFGSTHKNTKFAGIISFRTHEIVKYLTLQTDEAGLLRFFQSFKNGGLERYYKSEEPFNDTDRAVRRVAAKELDGLLMKEAESMLLFIYFKGSSHERQLLGEVDKLARNLRSKKSLILAKMDAAENEHQSILADRVPAIFLFKLGDKGIPIRHEAAWKAKDLMKFVERELERRLWFGEKREEILAESEL